MLKTKIISSLIILLLIPSLPGFAQDTDPEKSSRMGLEFGKQKQYNDAIEQFENAIKVYNIKSAKIYHNKGWVLELKNDIPGAISAYEEAIKRNPDQVPTLERLGNLYYLTGKYTEAVLLGEKVISLDPENKDVTKWLSDAYGMKLKKYQEELAAKKIEEKINAENTKGDTEQEKENKERTPELVQASMEFMIRTAYYFREGEEDRGYHYKNSPGLFMDIPNMLNVTYTPVKFIEINLETGKPYLGALSPNLIIQTEKIEVCSRFGRNVLGLGFLGNHYKDIFAYSDETEYKEYDYKFGIIFGYGEDKADLLFTIYPRFIFKDDEHSSGRTLDADYARFDYRYKIDELMTFYSWTSIKDYYYFDHDNDFSNYWGIYEFGFGVNVGRFREISKRIKFINYINVNADYSARIYLRDLNNDDPYAFANGQGLFGANSDKWFKGDPFSGFRSVSHVLTLKAEQGFLRYFFTYQKIIVEIADRDEDHNEFNFVIGVGGVY